MSGVFVEASVLIRWMLILCYSATMMLLISPVFCMHNITLNKKMTDGSISRTRLHRNVSDLRILSFSKVKRKDNGLVWFKRSNSSARTNNSVEVKGRTPKIEVEFVPSSPYQSQLGVAKLELNLAGSQSASADATSDLLTSHPWGNPKKLIFCYYGSSSNARPGIGKFWPENIDPFLCTHLIFAFVDITEDGKDLKPNNWNDLGDDGLYSRTLKLKEKNPDLKILLAVGGWRIGSKPFLPVIKSAEIWKIWVSNVIKYLRKFDFDGFDMDWEFPTWRGSAPEDKHRFTLLMKDLYEAFAEEAKSTGKERLILTLAAASSAFYAEQSYEQGEIHKYIDYMLLMTYNYHGSGWEKYTGHHSPLLPHPLDPEGEQRELYVLWSLKYWLDFGVPREKMILGLATYGLGWKLTDVSQTGVRAPADGGTTKGKYSEESGILSHFEICENVKEEGWKVEWIDEQKVPYAYGGGQWVGFDSPDSFYLKAATIIKENLAGAFVWSVEMDDFNGLCGGPKYPLLRTIYEVFSKAHSVANLDSLDSFRSSLDHHSSHSHSSSAAAKDGPSGSESNHKHSSNSDTNHEQSSHSEPNHEHNSHSEPSKSEDSVSSSSNSHSHVDYNPEPESHYDSYYTYDDDSDSHIDAFNCNSKGLGIHPDPTSCLHFILCMPVSQHDLGSKRMNCPLGTLFDEKIKVCNHQHNVICQH